MNTDERGQVWGTAEARRSEDQTRPGRKPGVAKRKRCLQFTPHQGADAQAGVDACGSHLATWRLCMLQVGVGFHLSFLKSPKLDVRRC